MTPNEAGVHRLSELLRLPVVDEGGRELGHVNDVRLAPTGRVKGVFAELAVVALIVADRHSGSLLGYDRRADQGPWLVRVIVRALHRRAGLVRWSSVRQVDWAAGQIVVRGPLEPLGASGPR
jgi:sporulation protein YlmC with PRC-barrel domain